MTLSRSLLTLALAATLTGCDSDDTVTSTATATVSPPAGVTSGGISGTVTLTQSGTDGDVTMRLNLTGATPGEHGFHIHTVGSCAQGVDPGEGPDPIPAGQALGHFDPVMTMDHGAPDDDDDSKHAADFGNVTAAANGTITETVTTSEVTLSGTRSVTGRPVMFHAGQDDLETDPGGMSGTRVGCGVVSAVVPSTDS